MKASIPIVNRGKGRPGGCHQEYLERSVLVIRDCGNAGGCLVMAHWLVELVIENYRYTLAA